ncbi:hypothetical protein ACFL49_02405 [Candidatus Omnitrophota bacterium]
MKKFFLFLLFFLVVHNLGFAEDVAFQSANSDQVDLRATLPQPIIQSIYENKEYHVSIAPPIKWNNFYIESLIENRSFSTLSDHQELSPLAGFIKNTNDPQGTSISLAVLNFFDKESKPFFIENESNMNVFINQYEEITRNRMAMFIKQSINVTAKQYQRIKISGKNGIRILLDIGQRKEEHVLVFEEHTVYIFTYSTRSTKDFTKDYAVFENTLRSIRIGTNN